MTFDNAVIELTDRIMSHDPQSDAMFADEPVFVAYFAIFFCLKFTRHRSWKKHGRDVFDCLTQTLLQHLNADFDSDIINPNKIQERMNLYSLAITISSENPSPSNVAQEVGVTFAMIQGEEQNEQLIRKGAEIFMKETDPMFDLFKKYDLVK